MRPNAPPWLGLHYMHMVDSARLLRRVHQVPPRSRSRSRCAMANANANANAIVRDHFAVVSSLAHAAPISSQRSCPPLRFRPNAAKPPATGSEAACQAQEEGLETQSGQHGHLHSGQGRGAHVVHDMHMCMCMCIPCMCMRQATYEPALTQCCKARRARHAYLEIDWQSKSAYVNMPGMHTLR